MQDSVSKNLDASSIPSGIIIVQGSSKRDI